VTTQIQQRVINLLMETITAAGQLPESVLRDRMLGHLFEARTVADQMIGHAGTRGRVMDAPMGSRMS
jgi:hypothetical protein